MNLYSDAVKAQAKQVLDTLTLREKIGQMVQFNVRNVKNLTEKYSYSEIAERFPFGSFFSGIDVIGLVGKRLRGIDSLENYNKVAKIPLIVSGDLENGGGGEPLPPQIVLAAADDPELAYNFGRVIAQRGRSTGFHWTFAPVVDVILSWLAPAVGVRALGADPEKVAVLAENIVKGMQDHGLCATAKHFPGDGFDVRNQHLGVAVDEMSRDEWEKSFGKVYRRVIDAGVRSIMAGHIALPCVDPRRFPAVLSEKISTDLLRNELGFDGVLVSDALIMSGFVSFRSYEKRMIAQINAGIDVMLWPEEDIFDLLEKAVEWGDIPAERIDESARRQLEMKVASGVIGGNAMKIEDASDYDDIGRQIAEKGTVLVRDRKKVLPLDQGKVKKVMVYIADFDEKAEPNPEDKRYKIILDGLKAHGAEVVLKSKGNCLDIFDFERNGGQYDAVIFLFTQFPNYNIRICGPALEAVWMASNTIKHDPVIVSLYSPYVVTENPAGTAAVINACSDCPASQRAVVKLLYGEIPFKGKSPVPLYADDSAQDEWEKISYKCCK